MTRPQPASKNPTGHYPPHSSPRVWFITAAASPISISLARELLPHGDIIVAGDDGNEDSTRSNELAALLEDAGVEGWGDRLRVVKLVSSEGMSELLPIRSFPISAIDGESKATDGKVAVIGTVEELAMSAETQTLIRDQFETKFFGPVNVIKAVLPSMRLREKGHVLVLSDVSEYCSMSLAYEIAPFNIRMTILQTNLETTLLTNKLTFAPPLPAYTPAQNPAPLVRSLVRGLLSRLPASTSTSTSTSSSSSAVTGNGRKDGGYPALPASMKAVLLAETLHALTAIGGHENPPARHIVGFEAVGSVKEKLKTVSEELEDFVEVSAAVDIDEEVEG
ncbi:MAG: hypothetical protein Q9195_005747 [Heterodermia aff. obscurata]